MPDRSQSRIEDYALLGNMRTAALVDKTGSVDWLCLPRFDSAACFAALLGTRENGCWSIRPQADVRQVNRRYRDDTMVLETEFGTGQGRVRLVDAMPVGSEAGRVDLLRLVEGLEGSVPMRCEMTFRFDYGRTIPWMRREGFSLYAVAGPNSLRIDTPVELRGQNMHTTGDFVATAGSSTPFAVTWFPSYGTRPQPFDVRTVIAETEAWWKAWISSCTYEGAWSVQVRRSLLTLKALTHVPTGGIIAAPTTSLPEWPGSARNWDYRYCWLRDSTFTLAALLHGGFEEEALAWRNWLLRAAAGSPAQLQVLYGVAGERLLHEYPLEWLGGYEGSRPVRVGNAASQQLQLDIYGEIMDTLSLAQELGVPPDPDAWAVQRAMVNFIQQHWEEPDHGIWEVRGPRRHFVHSKVMSWVAIDRAVRLAERLHLEGPVEDWKKLRARMHDEVCTKGFDPVRGSFVAYFGGDTLDASLLMLPLVGFLPPGDPRIVGTVEAIRRELSDGFLVRRYPTRPELDGLPSGEGTFLASSFWLVDALVLMDRHDEASKLFERLVGLCNDVGLLAEEYDPAGKRFLGNFPQAFSHVGLVNSACNLTAARGPAKDRAQGDFGS